MSPSGGILDEIRRRKRWEREILRDALRGNLRVAPDSPWLPSGEILERTGQLLRQGGDDRSRRSLPEALQNHEALEVIAEVKRASPSAGRFASWTDPAPLVEAYAEGGAAVLSVLTDSHFFDGRPEFLPLSRALFAGPVLRKDFLEDELDLAVSAALGADAVLAIVSVLGPQVAGLIRTARCYDLDVLVEVHDEREMELAMAAGAGTLGINNRDLTTFRTDLEVTERLAGLVPDPVVLVSESGIRSPEDAARMRRAGADGILVGEHLARREGQELPELRIQQPRGNRA